MLTVFSLEDLCLYRIGSQLTDYVTKVWGVDDNGIYDCQPRVLRWRVELFLESLPPNLIKRLLLFVNARTVENLEQFCEGRGISTEHAWEAFLKQRCDVSREGGKLTRPSPFDSISHVAPLKMSPKESQPDFSFRRVYLEDHFHQLLATWPNRLDIVDFQFETSLPLLNGISVYSKPEMCLFPRHYQSESAASTEEKVLLLGLDMMRLASHVRRLSIIGSRCAKIVSSDLKTEGSTFLDCIVKARIQSLRLSHVTINHASNVIKVLEAIIKGGCLKEVSLGNPFLVEEEELTKIFQLLSFGIPTQTASSLLVTQSIQSLSLNFGFEVLRECNGKVVDLEKAREILRILFPPAPSSAWTNLRKIQVLVAWTNAEMLMKHLYREGYLERLTHILMDGVEFPSALDFLFALQFTSKPEEENKDSLFWRMESLDEILEQDWDEEEEVEEKLDPLHVQIKANFVTPRHSGRGAFAIDKFDSFQRRTIKTLDLSHNRFDADNIDTLVKWFGEAGDKLETLRLRDCYLAVPCLCSLFSGLRRLPQLANLDLSFNSINGQAAQALCRFLGQTSASLKELSISHCNLPETLFRAVDSDGKLEWPVDGLVASLRRHRTLSFLSLAGNRLGRELTQTLKSLLLPRSGPNRSFGGQTVDRNSEPEASLPRLRAVDLGYNLVGEEDLLSFAEDLSAAAKVASRPVLDWLDLSGNPIGLTQKGRVLGAFADCVGQVDCLVVDLTSLMAEHVAQM